MAAKPDAAGPRMLRLLRVMTTPHTDAAPAADLTHRQRTIIIVGLMTGLMLAALDTATSQLGEPPKSAVTAALFDSITTTFLLATFVMIAAFIVTVFMREIALRTTTTAQSATAPTPTQEPA
ncbi:MAG: hypothetical protein R8G01_15810 [Ilumatobacteraceae bacterium]|nr:hypothetical protein [Ilumatobacteraceae bacterium]